MHSREKNRGGVTFFNSVTQSLKVKNYVRNRALRCKESAVPVKIAVDKWYDARVKSGGVNLQSTVNKCAKGAGPKDRKLSARSGAQFAGNPTEVPAQFFCLPFFDAQDVQGVEAGPSRSEDAAKFHFVVLNK